MRPAKSAPDAKHVEGLPGLRQRSVLREKETARLDSQHTARDAKHVEGLPGLRQWLLQFCWHQINTFKKNTQSTSRPSQRVDLLEDSNQFQR